MLNAVTKDNATDADASIRVSVEVAGLCETWEFATTERKSYIAQVAEAIEKVSQELSGRLAIADELERELGKPPS